ncbi:hypothetical protein [Helicobacter sp. MIT 01-3238]|uniref:hypothetical protein n=1 Tax=Helicobacter sp. MIT 01-3238 TaxID=398627 RepID=UPI0011C03A16|nr:hypothetical protein [Helicobacter sp. MIT 01-3238]
MFLYFIDCHESLRYSRNDEWAWQSRLTMDCHDFATQNKRSEVSLVKYRNDGQRYRLSQKSLRIFSQ